jgi:hypothetical protein
VICPPCRDATDAGTPHGAKDCDDNGRDYRGCPCQHRPARRAPRDVKPSGETS